MKLAMHSFMAPRIKMIVKIKTCFVAKFVRLFLQILLQITFNLCYQVCCVY